MIHSLPARNEGGPVADRSSSRDASNSERKTSAGGSGDTAGQAPGLGEQFGRTKSAFLGLVRAHIDLARVEFGEIGGQIKRAAALGGAALILLFLAGILISVGLLLFLGELIFGSIGWGLLHGSELLLGSAALLAFAIIDLSPRRAASALLVALGVGLVVTGLLAVDWNWVSGHSSGMPGALILAPAAGAALAGLVGLVLGLAFGRGPASAGLVAGAVCGILLGLLAAAGPGLRVASAMGVAILLLMWPGVAAVLVFRRGIDTAKLRQRFVPEQTIETTKETIKWLREQMPLGRKS
jgi:hypothetical protein